MSDEVPVTFSAIQSLSKRQLEAAEEAWAKVSTSRSFVTGKAHVSADVLTDIAPLLYAAVVRCEELGHPRATFVSVVRMAAASEVQPGLSPAQRRALRSSWDYANQA